MIQPIILNAEAEGFFGLIGVSRQAEKNHIHIDRRPENTDNFKLHTDDTKRMAGQIEFPCTDFFYACVQHF